MKILLSLLLLFLIISCGNKQLKSEFTKDSIKIENKVLQEQKTDSIFKAEDYKIYPFDESSSDTSLVNFITKLKKIVTQKNANELLKFVDENVAISYGGAIYGKENFIKEWNLNNPLTSPLWKILEKTINLGGFWVTNKEYASFCYPYPHSSEIFNSLNLDYDPHYTAVCIKSKTDVFDKTKTKIIYSLNYDIVYIEPQYNDPNYLLINRITDATKGYALKNDFCILDENLLCLEKKDKIWKIISFARYD
jgi:predicted outer membrane repeat protein